LLRPRTCRPGWARALEMKRLPEYPRATAARRATVICGAFSINVPTLRSKSRPVRCRSTSKPWRRVIKMKTSGAALCRKAMKRVQNGVVRSKTKAAETSGGLACLTVFQVILGVIVLRGCDTRASRGHQSGAASGCSCPRASACHQLHSSHPEQPSNQRQSPSRSRVLGCSRSPRRRMMQALHRYISIAHLVPLLEFNLSKGRTAGSEVDRYNPGGHVYCTFELNDRGRGPKVAAHYIVADDGLPTCRRTGG